MKHFIATVILTFSMLYSQAQELMELSSGITLSNSISNNPESGTIRWTGSDFQGYDGNQWTSLTSASSNNSTNVMSYFIGLPNGIQTLLDAGETVPNVLAAGAQPSDFLGLRYLGGWIFQVNNDGTGLMSTSAPFFNQYEWGCSGLLIIGAIHQEIGYGQMNTAAIIAACPTTPQTLHAAAVADQWDPHNLTDWYLPSIEELELMHSILGAGENIADFELGFYWSSTTSGHNAYALFHALDQVERRQLSKDQEVHIWPIRNF